MRGVLSRSRAAQGSLQGARRFSGASIISARRPFPVTVSVAAIEEQASFQAQEPAAASGAAADAHLAEELELAELDAAQEQLLKWMMKDEDEQEADLDEMVDYDEFGDDEYADDLVEAVEAMVEETDYEFKVGDKVMGTVIEVDEDGAYVEVGAKATAFCPITECSFARLKTVSALGALHAVPLVSASAIAAVRAGQLGSSDLLATRYHKVARSYPARGGGHNAAARCLLQPPQLCTPSMHCFTLVMLPVSLIICAGNAALHAVAAPGGAAPRHAP